MGGFMSLVTVGIWDLSVSPSLLYHVNTSIPYIMLETVTLPDLAG